MSTTINQSGTGVLKRDGNSFGGRLVQLGLQELLDQFTTSNAGPMTGLRNCEGLGKINLIQINGNNGAMSIAGGKLAMARPTTGQSYPNYGILSEGVFRREPGLAFYATVNSSIPAGISLGFTNQTLTNSANEAFNFLATTALTVAENVVTVTVGESMTVSTDYQFAIIQRAAGAYYFIRGGSQYPNWTLVWVGGIETTMDKYIQVANNNSACSVDNFGIKRKTGIWQDDYAPATMFVLHPTSGQTATCDANFVTQVVWTPVANEILRVYVRWISDNDCTYFEMTQSAGTIKLWEVVAGVLQPERDAGKTQTFTANTAYRLVFRGLNGNLRSYVNTVAKHNYASGINTSATGAKITWSGGTNGGAVVAWASWAGEWAGTDIDSLAPNGATISTATNNNLFLWETDSHYGDKSGTGTPTPAQYGRAVTEFQNCCRFKRGLHTGDTGENFSENSRDWRWNHYDRLRFPQDFIDGNHDEDFDYTAAVANSWNNFRTIFPLANFPENVVYDWPEAKIRFICPKTSIVHSPDANAGLAQIDSTARTWLQNQLATLPATWWAFVGTHFPGATEPGNHIAAGSYGGTALRAIFTSFASVIKLIFCGHRHIEPTIYSASGDGYPNSVPFMVGASAAYWAGTPANNNGAFHILTYDSGANTLTIRIHEARPPYNELRRDKWTPLVFNL